MRTHPENVTPDAPPSHPRIPRRERLDVPWLGIALGALAWAAFVAWIAS